MSISPSLRISAVESMMVSTPSSQRLALSVVRWSTSRVLGAAVGSVSHRIWPEAVSGTSMGSGSGLSPGRSKGVPSCMMPTARRSANLLCCARSRSISSSAKPHG